jgi:predicted amidohydrolase
MGLRAATPDLMVDQVLEVLKQANPYKPDFVCLPEVFPFAGVEKQTSPYEKVEISGRVLTRFSEYSKQNNCYTICPVYTRRNGKIYNSAIVFDRKGNKIGSYDKIHLGL